MIHWWPSGKLTDKEHRTSSVTLWLFKVLFFLMCAHLTTWKDQNTDQWIDPILSMWFVCLFQVWFVPVQSKKKKQEKHRAAAAALHNTPPDQVESLYLCSLSLIRAAQVYWSTAANSPLNMLYLSVTIVAPTGSSGSPGLQGRSQQ